MTSRHTLSHLDGFETQDCYVLSTMACPGRLLDFAYESLYPLVGSIETSTTYFSIPAENCVLERKRQMGFVII